ncbi:MAG: ABC transporter ATP-binding protein [Candidatus Omnitrophica bacterium]|nr:ABC transporter ATP-binding protein [Candidatus Omnitrophota bacterium]
MNKIKLRAVNLSKRYKNGKKEVYALSKLNLEIDRGEFLAIVGPSGAGKSTLLHLLGTLDCPSNGELFLDNMNIARLNPSQRAEIRNREIGFVFQFYHLLPEFTTLENVMMPGKIRGQKTEDRGRKIKQRAENLLERLGLENRMSHRPSELSGGEQQRVAIARAMINDPQILLCDEPTGNLDSQNGERIINILEKLKGKEKTLIIVSHEHNIVQKADRILEMRDGRVK